MGTWIHPTRLEIVFSGTGPVGLAGIHHDEGMVSKLHQVNYALDRLCGLTGIASHCRSGGANGQSHR